MHFQVLCTWNFFNQLGQGAVKSEKRHALKLVYTFIALKGWNFDAIELAWTQEHGPLRSCFFLHHSMSLDSVLYDNWTVQCTVLSIDCGGTVTTNGTCWAGDGVTCVGNRCRFLAGRRRPRSVSVRYRHASPPSAPYWTVSRIEPPETRSRPPCRYSIDYQPISSQRRTLHRREGWKALNGALHLREDRKVPVVRWRSRDGGYTTSQHCNAINLGWGVGVTTLQCYWSRPN